MPQNNKFNLTLFTILSGFYSPLSIATITLSGDVSPNQTSEDPWSVTGKLIVGRTTNGTLNINDSQVSSGSLSSIGHNSTATGDVVISGQSGNWTHTNTGLMTNQFFVGYNGTANLSISNGGHLAVLGNPNKLYLTKNQGASTVTLDGQQSYLSSNFGFYVARGDTASATQPANAIIRINNKAQVISEGYMRVGYQPYSIGKVIVNSGSNLSVNGTGADSISGLAVGNRGGHGYLLVTNGATVNVATKLWFGRQNNSYGEGVIRGLNTKVISLSSGCYVGGSPSDSASLVGYGRGKLIVDRQAELSCSSGFIGYLGNTFGNTTVTSEGAVTVDSGAKWDVGYNLNVGGLPSTPGGKGTLNVKSMVRVGTNPIITNGTLGIYSGLSSVNLLPNGNLIADIINVQTGSFNFTGGKLTTNIYKGALKQQGSETQLAPGGDNLSGTTTINGSYTLENGTINIDLGSTEIDKIIVYGPVNLGANGHLKVVAPSDFKPSIGTIYKIVTGTNITGTFATTIVPTFVDRKLVVEVLSKQIRLVVKKS